MENYRPVASLCSTSKIFEQLILNKIKKLELENEINLVGKQQHGFTKGKTAKALIWKNYFCHPSKVNVNYKNLTMLLYA